MDAEATELTVRSCLAEARIRLDKAAGIARAAADACAGAGFSDKAVEITLDIEQPLYEASTLLNAVSLINRIRKGS
jgi:ATP/maltotriose-dependent transcriptional regulator MalT